MTTDDLAQFVHENAGCELAILADTRTQTILCAHSKLRLGQERLDDLCKMAARLFAAGPELTDMRHITDLGQSLFFRAAPDTCEALCALCSRSADLENLDVHARTLLGRSSG